jgi:hypothetical protein
VQNRRGRRANVANGTRTKLPHQQARGTLSEPDWRGAASVNVAVAPSLRGCPFLFLLNVVRAQILDSATLLACASIPGRPSQSASGHGPTSRKTGPMTTPVDRPREPGNRLRANAHARTRRSIWIPPRFSRSGSLLFRNPAHRPALQTRDLLAGNAQGLDVDLGAYVSLAIQSHAADSSPAKNGRRCCDCRPSVDRIQSNSRPRDLRVRQQVAPYHFQYRNA